MLKYLKLKALGKKPVSMEDVPEGIVVAEHARDKELGGRVKLFLEKSLDRVKERYPWLRSEKAFARLGLEVYFLPGEEFERTSGGEAVWGAVCYIPPFRLLVNEDDAADSKLEQRLQAAVCEHAIGKAGWGELEVPPGLSWGVKEVLSSALVKDAFGAAYPASGPHIVSALFFSRALGLQKLAEAYFLADASPLKKAADDRLGEGAFEEMAVAGSAFSVGERLAGWAKKMGPRTMKEFEEEARMAGVLFWLDGGF